MLREDNGFAEAYSKKRRNIGSSSLYAALYPIQDITRSADRYQKNDEEMNDEVNTLLSPNLQHFCSPRGIWLWSSMFAFVCVSLQKFSYMDRLIQDIDDIRESRLILLEGIPILIDKFHFLL